MDTNLIIIGLVIVVAIGLAVGIILSVSKLISRASNNKVYQITILIGLILIVSLSTAYALIKTNLIKNLVAPYRDKASDQSVNSSQQIEKELTLIRPQLDNSWKTYINSYGYQINYPSQWKLIEMSPQINHQVIRLAAPESYQLSAQDVPRGKIAPRLDITTFSSLEALKAWLRLENKTLKDLFNTLQNKFDGYYQYSNPIIFKIENVEAMGITKTNLPPVEESKEFVILIENSKFYYLLEFNNRQSISELNEQEKNILASLTLIEPVKQEINPVPLASVNAWKTYENRDLGINIRLPDNWTVESDGTNINIASPREIEEKEWCALQYCEIPNLGKRLIISRYDNFKAFAEGFGYSYRGDTTSLEAYLKDQMAANTDIISYEKITINNYPAFAVSLGGFCGDYAFLTEHNEKIYEFFYSCMDKVELSGTGVDGQILNSLKLF